MGEEVDSKKKLDQRKKELVKQKRKIDQVTDVPRKVVDEHKEKWRQVSQGSEQRRQWAEENEHLRIVINSRAKMEDTMRPKTNSNDFGVFWN